MFPLRDVEGGIQFAVRVQPGAKREGLTGVYGDALKIAISAPAVDGKANDALIRYLASLLNVSRSSVHIVSGTSSRSKVVRMGGINAAAAQSIIAAMLP